MRIAEGWKIVLYLFCIVLLIQGFDLPYYMMNQKDSFVANLGLVVLLSIATGVLYCIMQMAVNGLKLIQKVEQKEKQKQK